MIACIGFYFGFSVLWLLHYTCSYPAFPLVFYSTSLLLLSYHIMSFPCLISTAVYLLAPACLCLRHGFHVYGSDLSILMCLSMLAIWLLHHHSPGSSDSSGSSCPGFGAWSMWIPSVVDQSGAAVAWISSRPSRASSFQAPCSALEFSCYDSEPPFVLFILITLYSRNCAILVM